MITTITPCYRSAQYLPQVVEGIKTALSGHDYQIILVCDGSPDNTFEVIRELCAQDENILGINLTRNFGQPSARCAAIPHVKGEYVVFIDDDGEHSPDDILSLVAKLEEGYDIAYADFADHTHGLLKQAGSKINYAMMKMLLGVPKGIRPTSFFATKKFVAKSLENYTSPTPYSIGYFLQVTKNVTMVKIKHCSRISGKSSYSFRKMLSIWLNGFTSFSVVPLRVASIIGICTSLFGFLFGAFTVVRKLLDPSIVEGFSTIVAVLLFTSGLIMFLLGLLGEYVGRIFISINNLPQYFVREVLNEDSYDE